MKMLPRIYGDLLTPIDLRSMETRLFGKIRSLRWHEIADLLGHARIADVEDAQASVEPGDINQLAGLLNRGIVYFLACVVRPKAATFVAEVLVGRV